MGVHGEADEGHFVAVSVRSGIHVDGADEVIAGLQKLGLDVSDLKSAFASLASKAAGAASAAAPRRSGRLAASIRPKTSKNYASARTSLPYAGVINYGSSTRNIAPARFMQHGDAVIRPIVVTTLEQAINRAIAAKGL